MILSGRSPRRSSLYDSLKAYLEGESTDEDEDQSDQMDEENGVQAFALRL
jgi:predicted house-cleaning NTP pyrophosphatase (Maf/HAM1 superfamily)